MNATLHLEEVIGQIAAPAEGYLAQAKTRLDTLTKPLGSLGRLEDLAAQWFAIRQGNMAGPVSKAVYVFAADGAQLPFRRSSHQCAGSTPPGGSEGGGRWCRRGPVWLCRAYGRQGAQGQQEYAAGTCDESRRGSRGAHRGPHYGGGCLC